MSARTERWAAAGLAAALVLAPAASEACAVCFSASDENRAAFTFTTVLLSLLPLAMIGSTVLWLFVRLRRVSRERAVEARLEFLQHR